MDMVVIECGFTNEEQHIGRDAKHYYPNALAEDLKKLNHRPDLYITHLQPGREEKILQQLNSVIKDFNIHQLSSGQIISI